MEQILTTAVEGQGIWTVLAVFLLVYVLKTSGEREKKLQDIIDKLTEKFNLVEIVKEDVDEIKTHIFNHKDK